MLHNSKGSNPLGFWRHVVFRRMSFLNLRNHWETIEMARNSNKPGKALVPAETVLEGEIITPETVNAGPTKEMHSAIETSIRTKLAQYLAGKDAAHLAVIEAIMWAAKHGEAQYLNVAFDVLGGFDEKPSADAENLRSRRGKASAFTTADDKETTWLGYNQKASEGKKKGFFVKSGLQFAEARKNMDELALKQGPRFMDRIPKLSKPLTMEDVLRLAAKFSETVDNKEKKVIETGATPLPASFKAMLADVSSEAIKLSGQLKRVQPAS